MQHVPVVDCNQEPLMPTTPSIARLLVKQGKATPFWKNGIFCIRLNYEPDTRHKQAICVGVDPGSKKEGFTVKSEDKTYLNVQADAHNKVGKKIKIRHQLRRGRRSRKCPNRKQRMNRLANKARIPAGTRARWDWKRRILDWLAKIYPVTHVCVEDIKARPRKGQRKWNESFSPLAVGKQWFYAEIQKRWELHTLQGYETKEIRDSLGLKKSSNKMSSAFTAHCVDSWCLASSVVGDNGAPDNTSVFCISPIPIRRRELHRQNPQKGGKRPRYGGTMCLGYPKGTLVKHIKHGLAVVCGFQKNGLSLQPAAGGKRLCLSAKMQDCKILTKLNFRHSRGAVSSQA